MVMLMEARIGAGGRRMRGESRLSAGGVQDGVGGAEERCELLEAQSGVTSCQQLTSVTECEGR